MERRPRSVAQSSAACTSNLPTRCDELQHDNQADELRLIACFDAESVLGLNPANGCAVNFSYRDEMFLESG